MGCAPQRQGFLFLPPKSYKRFCSPASVPPGTLKRMYSLNHCSRLLAFTCRCANETKMPCLGSLLRCIGGCFCSVAGNLRWFYFKIRKEVQKLASVVGLAQEEEGAGGSPFRRTQILLKSKLAIIEQLPALPSADARAAQIHWHQR